MGLVVGDAGWESFSGGSWEAVAPHTMTLLTAKTLYMRGGIHQMDHVLDVLGQ